MIRFHYRKTVAKEFVQWDMTAETSHGTLDFHVRLDKYFYLFDRDGCADALLEAKREFKGDISWYISGEVLKRMKAKAR